MEIEVMVDGKPQTRPATVQMEHRDILGRLIGQEIVPETNEGEVLARTIDGRCHIFTGAQHP
ncbi:hypothetical protein [Caldimonas sp. KR1-144]|uniref:hypothetical protein n=1 Tax=Caldimonas sp. KR1-144 TaxID=3400911 RepID=UPI003C001590